MFSWDEIHESMIWVVWIFPKVLTNELKPEMRVVWKTESARRHRSCHRTAHRCVCNLKFILLVIIVIKTWNDSNGSNRLSSSLLDESAVEMLTQPEEEDDKNHHRCCGLRNACWDTRLTSASVTWTEPGWTSGLNGVGGRGGFKVMKRLSSLLWDRC